MDVLLLREVLDCGPPLLPRFTASLSMATPPSDTFLPDREGEASKARLKGRPGSGDVFGCTTPCGLRRVEGEHGLPRLWPGVTSDTKPSGTFLGLAEDARCDALRVSGQITLCSGNPSIASKPFQTIIPQKYRTTHRERGITHHKAHPRH